MMDLRRFGRGGRVAVVVVGGVHNPAALQGRVLLQKIPLSLLRSAEEWSGVS